MFNLDESEVGGMFKITSLVIDNYYRFRYYIGLASAAYFLLYLYIL